MLACAQCGSQIHETSRFCSSCGVPNPAVTLSQSFPARPTLVYPQPIRRSPGSGVVSFGQFFGLDPRIAFLTLVVDAMLFGGDILTMGTSMLLSVPAGIVIGFITYKAQRHWYRDDRESAMIKGLIVALLTAIPTSLPGFLTIPSGLIGMIHLLRRKKTDDSLVIDRRIGT
jgi:hypothetical protein